MTAHELAKLLLEGRDLKVLVRDFDGCWAPLGSIEKNDYDELLLYEADDDESR